jgi:hypothetical protein
VHGHRYQPERRKNRTQANSTRDPWIRIGNHDVIAPIKTINYELKCRSSLHEWPTSVWIGVCRSAARTLNPQVGSDWSRLVVPCSSGFVSGVRAGVTELGSESIARSQLKSTNVSTFRPDNHGGAFWPRRGLIIINFCIVGNPEVAISDKFRMVATRKRSQQRPSSRIISGLLVIRPEPNPATPGGERYRLVS